jgi:hypothetical protein
MSEPMLSTDQVTGLREAYSILENVNDAELQKLKQILNGSSPTVLKQLAGANIKYVSAMATELVSVQGVRK